MATTLALPTHPSDLLEPPPSQDFAAMPQQVPDVFVIPPEEEQEDNPPWCYFDATAAAEQTLSTHPDVDALDIALGLCQQTDNRSPAFHRHFTNESQDTIVMPRRGGPRIVKLSDMDVDVPMEDSDGVTDIRSRGGARARSRSPFDEEIVEVVKVRRNEGMTDVGEGRTLKMKKSSTFRARASQALRSIKNVGKSTRRATVSEPKLETGATATLPSRHSYQDAANARPMSPATNRRRSLTLSQMFAFKENHNSRPVSPIVDEPVISSPIPNFESAPPARPMSPTDVSGSHAKRLQPSPSIEDYMATPTRSPSSNGDYLSKPTLSKRKSFRRRLSVLELQKLFSIGGSSNSQPDNAPPPAPPTPDIEEDLFSPTESRPLSMDSAGILSAASSRKSSVSLGDMVSRPSYSSQRTGSGGDAINEDAELEMRLDSLHFDSLHFDPDEILSSL
ncbi:hypothetical protein C8Q79DRAFT_956562 [Trametes meyenii]|nr:hypothetical protein C8Q79DRAFT_956562 [Trametes meyenii]